MKHFALGLLLAAAAPVSIATETANAEESRMAESMTYLVTFQSTPGITLDEFVHSFSRNASIRSEAIDAEVCGEFRRAGDGYSIELFTTFEPDACRYPRRRDDGHTGQGFHTHLKGQPLTFSKDDLQNPGYMACGATLLHQNGPGTIRKVPKPTEHGN